MPKSSRFKLFFAFVLASSAISPVVYGKIDFEGSVSQKKRGGIMKSAHRVLTAGICLFILVGWGACESLVEDESGSG